MGEVWGARARFGEDERAVGRTGEGGEDELGVVRMREVWGGL